MGLFGKKKEEPEAKAEVASEPHEEKRDENRVVVPHVIYKLASQHFVRVGFHNQEPLSCIEPFTMLSVKLRKQNSKNIPAGWEVDPAGAVAFDSNKRFLCVIDGDRMAKNGLEYGKTYHAFVVPPCVDVSGDLEVESRYVLCILI